jgi:hypothetical protein
MNTWIKNRKYCDYLIDNYSFALPIHFLQICAEILILDFTKYFESPEIKNYALVRTHPWSWVFVVRFHHCLLPVYVHLCFAKNFWCGHVRKLGGMGC